MGIKKRYKCNNCKYSFKTELEPNVCPYCGKSTIYLDVEDEEMIKNVDDWLK